MRVVVIKVLIINKFFYLNGGAETYAFSLRELLLKNGHQVIDFSMSHSRNLHSEYQDYFVDNIDYHAAASLGKKIILSAKIIYSPEARKKLSSLISAHRPDIVHLNNFHHQLSPSILYPLKANGIPVVYTVHDLKPMCPNYKMLSHGKICEKCKTTKYYQCFFNQCVKDSRAKSLISMTEMYIHKLCKVDDLIDVYIAPSKFMREKLIEYGFAAERVVYLPNFIDVDNYQAIYQPQKYFIYLGRLSNEKGLFTLINAMRSVQTDIQLWIVGTGPLEERIRMSIQELGLDDRIKLLGFKSGQELKGILQNAMFNIVPSECYENAPYSVLEMMAYGKSSIGSKIGGIPELIEDGKTGLVFETGNPDDLALKINRFLTNPELPLNFGKTARQVLETKFSGENHYRNLMNIYESAIHPQGKIEKKHN